MSYGFVRLFCKACNNDWTETYGMVGMQNMASGDGRCPRCKSDNIQRHETQALVAQRLVPEQENLTIKVYRATPTAKLPTKAYEEDLGYDLYADMKYYQHDGLPYPNLVSPWYVAGGSTTRISTGIHIELPKGYGAVMKPRSSQGSRNLDIYAGVEDGGYRGEWFVCVHNSNIAPLYINPGEKIGQFILIKNPQSAIVEVQSLGQLSESQRGSKGFGSSGK